jgi:transposase
MFKWVALILQIGTSRHTGVIIGRMNDVPKLTHTRLDAIPLLLGVLMQMEIPQLYDREIGDHGLHTGLSGGWMLTIWLTFILSQSDHTKYKVEEWVARYQVLLASRTRANIKSSEFNDNRLSSLLSRLSKPQRWERFEDALWKHSVDVYQLEMQSVGGLYSAHVDSTTACGYHEPQTNGLMQRGGHSKDHRPDLAQLKLMTVATHPHGHLAVTQVTSGNTADDVLYLPIIARARVIFNRIGMLYSGDSKMAALVIRATITHDGDYYLVVAPLTGETAQLFSRWIEQATSGMVPTVRLYNDEGTLIGRGYEFERQCTAELAVGKDGAGEPFSWNERVQIYRSEARAAQQIRVLDKQLKRAKAALLRLTPKPKQGRRQFHNEAKLEEAVKAILKQQGVEGLLTVKWVREEKAEYRFVGRGRPTASSKREKVIEHRCRITKVTRNQEAIAAKRQQVGWRVQLTNAPAAIPFQTCIIHYRSNWCGERNYHRLKSQPIGIDRIFVRSDDQLAGLTYLLTLAARVEAVIEFQVARGLKEEKKQMKGLYSGLPQRATPTPTAAAILAAVARSEITLTKMEWEHKTTFQLTTMPELLLQVLHYLDLPMTLYTEEIKI